MTSSSPQVQEQQDRPIGRRPVSVRKGSGERELGGQGARVEGEPCGEIHGRGNGGRDTYLSCDAACRRSPNIQNLGLEVGVETRDLRQGAGSQSRITKGIELSVPTDFMCAMPTLLGTLPPQFKHLPMVSSCAPGTVRCACVQ